MLAVLSAIQHVMQDQSWQNWKILIYTDNMNTMEAFNFLNVDPIYNGVLKQAVDLQLETRCQVRVLHVEGVHNDMVDALSCGQLESVHHMCWGIDLIPFSPPWDSLGVSPQWNQTTSAKYQNTFFYFTFHTFFKKKVENVENVECISVYLKFYFFKFKKSITLLYK